MRNISFFVILSILLCILGSSAIAQGTGARAYMAFYEGGVQVFDISDPANPTVVGEFDTLNNEALDLTVRDNYAYIADGHGGFEIYDISNLEKVKMVSDLNHPCNARALSIDGDYAYVAAENSLMAYDIADPTKAFWVSTYTEDILSDQDIIVRDGIAYVACGVDGLKIYDVSDPKEITASGSVVPRGMVRGIALDGNYVYIAAGASGLQIVDVSDPADPVVVGSGLETDGAAWGVCINNGKAYVADRNRSVYIIDITNPTSLSILGIFKASNGRPSNIEVVDGIAYLAAHDGDLQILGVSDPSKPVLLSWTRRPGNARAIFIGE